MLFMAPLMGYTDYVFRNVFVKHFGGINLAITPYISLADGRRIKRTHIKDLLPENNRMRIIPQVMGSNVDQFKVMANDLKELGYDSINWNLGCPMRAVARKRRGSGLLPYPDVIKEVMEEVIPGIDLKFSIKTRLGYHKNNELDELISAFNEYPLDFLVIHPRIGTQLYEGPIDYDKLNEILPSINADVVYSGDIWNVGIYEELHKRFPKIKHWMLGRGLMKNLFLAEEIAEKKMDEVPKRKERFLEFHKELMDALSNRMVSEKNVTNKIKEYWINFKDMFVEGEDIFDRLKVISNANDLESFVGKEIEKQQMKE